MHKTSLFTRPSGCLILILNLIGLLANITDVIYFFRDLNDNIPHQLPPITPDLSSGDFVITGLVMFYEMTAIALLVWVIVSSKALGGLKSFVSATILQMLGSALFIISFYYKYSIEISAENVLQGFVVFTLLPLGVAFILVNLWLSPNH